MYLRTLLKLALIQKKYIYIEMIIKMKKSTIHFERTWPFSLAKRPATSLSTRKKLNFYVLKKYEYNPADTHFSISY